MTTTISTIAPIQGLLDYIQDVKPYHTKVVEILTEYVHNERVDVTMIESFNLNIEFIFPNNLLNDDADEDQNIGGFGGNSMFGVPDPAAWPVIPTDTNSTGPFDPLYLGYDSTNSTLTIPGDRTVQYPIDQTITVVVYDTDDDSVLDTTLYEITASEYILATTPTETSHTKLTVQRVLPATGGLKDESTIHPTTDDLYATVTLSPFDTSGIVFGYGNAIPHVYTANGPPPTPPPAQGPDPDENLYDPDNPADPETPAIPGLPVHVNSFIIPAVDLTNVFITGSVLEQVQTGDLYRVLHSVIDGVDTYIRVVETIPSYTPPTGSIKIREQIPGYSDSFFTAAGSGGTLSTTIADRVSFSWTDGANDVMYGYQYLIQTSLGNDLIVNGENLEFTVEVGDDVKIIDNTAINGIYEVTAVSGSTITVTPALSASQGGFVEKYTGP